MPSAYKFFIGKYKKKEEKEAEKEFMGAHAFANGALKFIAPVKFKDVYN